MKKTLKVIISIALISLLLIGIVPEIILYSLKKEAGEMPHYVESYVESKERFLTYEDRFRTYWRDTRFASYEIEQGLEIDVVEGHASESPQNLVIFTTGVHGIEGFVGSAMLNVFQTDYLTKLDPATTGVIFVHAVNPWGMENERRFNENNVDLNRNFIKDWTTFNLELNEAYADLATFFEKEEELGNVLLENVSFYSGVGYTALTSGAEKIEEALLSGQYTHPHGVYYGGEGDEKSTEVMKELYEQWITSDYENIVHIDLHTGYGPEDQMSIFSSIGESMTQKEAMDAFQYPLVLTPESEGFYVTHGDNTEYFHSLGAELAPEKEVYSTTFEFGTLGEDVSAGLSSINRTVSENQLYWHGSKGTVTEEITKLRYKEMFYPSDKEWREKAIKDFRQATDGVLSERGILK
ncbi:hypothetical protein Q75_16980 [Bacillus coahuilensis p1.1.43]|uniref:DUF2817 domain-containing protein n=1 Tax=Bacillus coahuilensis p1.1.43 TaxID=1150625 RepID=A0A147K3Z7_9BACI|nr:M14 family metallopeptidase [Bacillus coahuilensis]KUP04009.1 hypothetical protein Q75_16980 [Bacillus coahuilensis p1.1.43]